MQADRHAGQAREVDQSDCSRHGEDSGRGVQPGSGMGYAASNLHRWAARRTQGVYRPDASTNEGRLGDGMADPIHFIELMGIPASGKSTLAKSLVKQGYTLIDT